MKNLKDFKPYNSEKSSIAYVILLDGNIQSTNSSAFSSKGGAKNSYTRMIKHYGFHKDYGFETPKQMVKALEDIGRLKFLEINKDFIVSANCVTNNKEVRYSERDELHIFHVSDYTTELVGRYNKKLDIYYVYRGDNTVIAVCEGYRITKSQLIF